MSLCTQCAQDMYTFTLSIYNNFNSPAIIADSCVMAMSTEILVILGPSTALGFTNSSVSTMASEVELETSYPSPNPSPGINHTDAEALDDLADLPPLPSLTHDEIEDLDPTYPNYRAIIHYYTLSPSGTLTQETHPKLVSRASVLLSLEYFYTLRKHLTANLAILEQYPRTSLVGVHDSATLQLTSFTELETVQCAFAMHHIAINENLCAANSGWACQSFGLPDSMGAASDIRYDRNYFAHTFPTPTGQGIQLHWAIKRKAEVYEKLLLLVEDGIGVLQGQLDDMEIWVSPQVIERERLEREARKEEERLDKEGAEQDDGGHCMLEQEEEVDWMGVPQSTFSRVFDSLGDNAVARYCFRLGVVRNAGEMLRAWLGEMLAEADAVALRRAGEGATEECGEGDDWGSQECEIEDDNCGSQEYKIEDDDCHRSQDLDAHLSQPDSGWGDPQW